MKHTSFNYMQQNQGYELMPHHVSTLHVSSWHSILHQRGTTSRSDPTSHALLSDTAVLRECTDRKGCKPNGPMQDLKFDSSVVEHAHLLGCDTVPLATGPPHITKDFSDFETHRGTQHHIP